jgi:ankyrin repeat protein
VIYKVDHQQKIDSANKIDHKLLALGYNSLREFLSEIKQNKENKNILIIALLTCDPGDTGILATPQRVEVLGNLIDKEYLQQQDSTGLDNDNFYKDIGTLLTLAIGSNSLSRVKLLIDEKGLKIDNTFIDYAINRAIPLLSQSNNEGVKLVDSGTEKQILDIISSLIKNHKDALRNCEKLLDAKIGGMEVLAGKILLEVRDVLLAGGERFSDFFGSTIIYQAARENCPKVVEFLLEGKLDARANFQYDAEDLRDRTFVHIAAECGYMNILELVGQKIEEKKIIDLFHNTGQNRQTPLHLAVQNGHQKVVDFLISRGADVNCLDKSNRPALYYAIQNSHEEIMISLIKNGADINNPTLFNNRRSAMFNMNKMKHKLVQEDVRKYHDSVLHYNNFFQELLSYIVKNDLLESFKVIIEWSKISVNENDDLMIKALTYGSLKIMRNYIEIDTTKDDFARYFDYAIINGHLEMVKYLVALNPAIIKEKDGNGDLPIHRAVEFGYVEIVKCLAEYDPATLKEKDDSGCCPIHCAPIVGNLEMVKCLAEYDPATLTEKDNTGNLPIHSAAAYHRVEIVEHLAKCNPDTLKEKDKHGYLPIHHAINFSEYSSFEMVKCLIECDPSSIKEKNNEGKTVIDIALEKGYQEVAKYLKSKINDQKSQEPLIKEEAVSCNDIGKRSYQSLPFVDKDDSNKRLKYERS